MRLAEMTGWDPCPDPRRNLWVIGVVLLAAAATCCGENPFTVTPSVTASNGSPVLQVRFGVPRNHHVYADRVSFRWEGETAALPFSLPEPEMIRDKFSGELKKAFEHSFEATFTLNGLLTNNRTLQVRFQGCDEAECYFPVTRSFSISPAGEVRSVSQSPPTIAAVSGSTADWRQHAAGFQVLARSSGYMSSRNFLAFLDRTTLGNRNGEDTGSSLQRWGWLAMLGLILLGGIGLNLTPCILPLIPINLSIIGVGAKNSSRRRGFALGATYGLGMAFAYGLLGLVVVLTGSKFGTLNSSPWFNLAIAGVFVLLALGMFDKLSIDLSRFQGRLGPAPKTGARGPYFVALTMGSVAALLAGACVAPVVISVLLLATNLYNHGNWLGLALPFCLGLGMALPWPVAGAGLSLLPKPGAWMNQVKHGFGVIIVLFALYYGHIAYTLFSPLPVLAREAARPDRDRAVRDSCDEALIAALDQARLDGKPVVIDFWASWCKNCSAMEHTTFKDPTVRRRLEGFHQVNYQAERPNQSPAKPVLDYFGALGLPTYVVLTPAGTSTPATSSAADSVR